MEGLGHEPDKEGMAGADREDPGKGQEQQQREEDRKVWEARWVRAGKLPGD